MSAITKTFNDTEIRAQKIDGMMCVRATDVAAALGYSQTANYTRIIRDRYLQKVKGGTHKREVVYIEEPGLWQSLATTRKEPAIPFQDWLYEQVLPSLRKTNKYEVGDSNTTAPVQYGDGAPQGDGATSTAPAPRPEPSTDPVERARQIAQEEDRLQQKAQDMRKRAEAIERALAGVPARGDEATAARTNGTLRVPNKYDTPEIEQPNIDQQTPSEGKSNLQLKRPLVSFDLETTGLDTESAMLTEIAAYRLEPGADGQPVENESARLVTKVDPEEPISDHVTKITGITNEDVQGAPTFEDLMPHIASMVADADLHGYNAASYDVPLLESLFRRHGSTLPSPPARVVVDPYRVEQALRGNKLSEVYKRYEGEELKDAHSAAADTLASYIVLQNQIPALPISGDVTPSKIANLARGRYIDDQQKLMRDGDSVVVTFGKHDGKTLTTIRKEHPDYFKWMLDEDEFRPHLERIFDIEYAG